MNRKQFIILLILVALLGTAGWIIHERSQDSWHSAGQTIGEKLLPDLAVNDIAQISVQSGTNQLHLVRRNELWRVQERGDYAANFSQISDLLIKLADLKVAQSQAVGPSQLGRFELLPPGPGTGAGTQVEFQDQNGKVLNSLLLGKKHLHKPAGNAPVGGMDDGGWADGRYVLTGKQTNLLAVISDPLDNLEPRPDEWLNKDFLKLENCTALLLDLPEPTNSWHLLHATATNDWQLAATKAEEKLDATKISGITGTLNSWSFNDVTPATPAGLASLTNATLTVTTGDHFTYTVKIGAEENDNYPVNVAVTADLPTTRAVASDEKPADKAKLDQAFADQQKLLSEKLFKEKQLGNWIYQVPSFSVNSLLKTRSQLLVEAPKASDTTAAPGH